MDDKLVSDDKYIKDLGVNFQDDLKFEEHFSKICATANSRLGIIRRTLHTIDKEGFLILYKSFVRPILEYCNVIWAPHLRKHHKMIEQIQRRATRMIIGFDMLNYHGRLRALDIPTLVYRRKRADIIQVFRIMNKIDCISFDDFFEFDRGITRGNNKKLIKPRANTTLRLHSFSHRVINVWNDLPNRVVMSSSLNSFKSNLLWFWKDRSFKFEFDF